MQEASVVLPEGQHRDGDAWLNTTAAGQSPVLTPWRHSVTFFRLRCPPWRHSKETPPNLFVVLHPAFSTAGTCNSSVTPKVGLSSENSNLIRDGEEAAEPGLGKL